MATRPNQILVTLAKAGVQSWSHRASLDSRLRGNDGGGWAEAGSGFVDFNSSKLPHTLVTPAKAGVQNGLYRPSLDSRLRGNDESWLGNAAIERSTCP